MKYLIKVPTQSEIDGGFKGVALVESDDQVLVKGFGPGYEVVDLGLPSGLKWGSCNLGASSPEEAGLYFQWGDTKGYTAEQIANGEKEFSGDWSDYIFYNTANQSFTKYDGKDGLTTLEPSDDAATVMLGDNFRMPTREDFKELFLNTDQKLVLSDGEEVGREGEPDGDTTVFSWSSFTLGSRHIKGVKFIGSNGNSIFIPAAGQCDGGQMILVNESSNIWSSSLYEDAENYGWQPYFHSDGAEVFYDQRYYGSSIRAVCH